MKYGSQLATRSTPEWSYYNVDYDALKLMIKNHTRRRPIPIPVNSRDSADLAADPEFSTTFYAELVEECNRVELFVRTKVTELDTRLTTLSRRVSLLAVRYSPSPKSSIPFRLLERLSLLEEEILEAGVLLRKLSRFIVAQRTAFTKLLKKYSRWCGTSSVPDRFRRAYIDTSDVTLYLAPGALDSLFDWWLSVLTELRSLVLQQDSKDTILLPVSGALSDLPITSVDENDVPVNVPRPLVLPTLSSENLSPSLESAARSRIEAKSNKNSFRSTSEFDYIFDSVSSLREPSSCAVYWVHPDNLIELQILLNSHFNTLTSSSLPSSSSSPPTPVSLRPATSRRDSRASVHSSPLRGLSRQASSISLRNGRFGRDYEMDTTCLVFDDPARFGLSSRHPVAGIGRWASQDEVVVSLRPSLSNGKDGFPATPASSRIPEELFSQLLDPSRPFPSLPPAPIAADGHEVKSRDHQIGDLDVIRLFLESDRSVAPLARIRSRRIRYVGLHNTDDASVYAVLDQSIVFGDAKNWLKDCQGDDITRPASPPGSSFPFAVLSTRLDSSSHSANDSVMKLLDDSHLTYRVDGFSLFSHAVWDVCRPPSMPTPGWAAEMETDIRAKSTSGLQPNLMALFGQDQPRKGHGRFPTVSSILPSRHLRSTQLSDGSATDDTVVASPVTSLPLRSCGGRSRAESASKPSKLRSGEVTQLSSRYWSEYDNPDELNGLEDGDDAYVIYIDPNEPAFFEIPSFDWVGNFLRRFLPAAFLRPEIGSSEEHERLLNSQHPPCEACDDHSAGRLDRPFSHNVHVLHPDGQSQPMSALLNHLTSTHRAQVHSKLVLSIACVLAAIMLSATSLVLVASGRKRLRARVDTAVLFCVFISLGFSIAGCLYGLSYITDLYRRPAALVLESEPDSNNDAEAGVSGPGTGPAGPPVSAFGIIWRSFLLGTLFILTIVLDVLCIHWAI